MADVELGNIVNDIFNSEEVKLGYIDGADTKFFAAAQDITEHWERVESVIQTKSGSVYVYSKNHNNFVDFKMAVTRLELAVLHGFQAALSNKTWVIKGTDEAGVSTGATMTFTGKIPIIDKQNVVPGAQIITCRIRATQRDVTVT
ncbi:MAG: hypothetical protein JKY15_01975 [Deltaproteobacteria bacterium]|nr:hypothetical protein [Deltaproteobacteria bacterium]